MKTPYGWCEPSISDIIHFIPEYGVSGVCAVAMSLGKNNVIDAIASSRISPNGNLFLIFMRCSPFLFAEEFTNHIILVLADLKIINSTSFG